MSKENILDLIESLDVNNPVKNGVICAILDHMKILTSSWVPVLGFDETVRSSKLMSNCSSENRVVREYLIESLKFAIKQRYGV